MLFEWRLLRVENRRGNELDWFGGRQVDERLCVYISCQSQVESTDCRLQYKRPQEGSVRESLLTNSTASISLLPSLLYAFTLFYPRLTPPPLPLDPNHASLCVLRVVRPLLPLLISQTSLLSTANLLSPNGKPGPLLDNNPPPVVRPTPP